MRIQGNRYPDAVSVEIYTPTAGYAEVRLRENVNEVIFTDAINGVPVTMYEYDEYILHVKNRSDLQAEIEANQSEWLATGRALETNVKISAIANLNDEISAAESDMAALVDMIYESDLEVIG